jgi:hypothetical protein
VLLKVGKTGMASLLFFLNLPIFFAKHFQIFASQKAMVAVGALIWGATKSLA